MFPGLNPRKMQQAMKQLGIQQVDIPATEVIIRTAEKEIIIRNPSVAKVNMMGQESFQISGNIEERPAIEISEEDIKTVMEQTETDRATALQAIHQAQGDLAEAILKLQNRE